MKRQLEYSRRQIAKAFLLCILLCLTIKAHAQDDKLMVVANPKGSPAEVNYTELKSVLKGEKQRWKDGTKIVIAILKSDTPAGMITSTRVYGMTPDQLTNFCMRLAWGGKGNAPRFFDSVAELESFIAKTPGAIGVELANEQSANKPVLVDGKKSF